MSNNTVQINLKATDNASSVVAGASDKIAGSLKGVTQEIKQQTYDYKGLVVGISGAATASFGLYNAFDNVMDASVGVNKANLAVKTSTNAVEDAQTRYIRNVTNAMKYVDIWKLSFKSETDYDFLEVTTPEDLKIALLGGYTHVIDKFGASWFRRPKRMTLIGTQTPDTPLPSTETLCLKGKTDELNI